MGPQHPTVTAFRGRYVTPDDPGFEEAVLGRVFNGRRPANRCPQAVLFAADEADVQAGVRSAAERGWQVAVRSGGHSWAAWSVRDDALLIDLAAFTGTRLRRGDADRLRRSGGQGRRRARPVPRGARPVLRRRPLPLRRHRRLPAAGRAGLERPRLGLGRRADRGDRRRHRRRRARARRRDLAPRPVLGRARRGPDLPRHRHPVPPRDPAGGRPPGLHRCRSTRSPSSTRCCRGCTRSTSRCRRPSRSSR